MKKSASILTPFKMHKNLKKWIEDHIFFVGALFVVMAVSLFALVNFFNTMGIRSNEATLTLRFDEEGYNRTFAGEVVGGMTVLDALVSSSEAGQIKFQYAMASDGKIRVLELNGHGTPASLAFYLNGKEVDQAKIHEISIRPGDAIVIED
jgi:hypothetical protein